MNEGLIIDSFAGGGGASTGIEWALGRSPDFAINHDPEALAMHEANHPATVHLTENIWKVDPAAVTRGRPVFLLWASPDCRHHSKAKGGKPVSRSVRGLADVVILWAKVARPQIIALENVEEFQDWGPLTEAGRPCPDGKGLEFHRWVRALEAEGYAVEWRELRACDYGAPTIRKRLFVVARRDAKPILWPAPTHARPSDPRVIAGELKPWRTAAEIVDWSLPCPSIFLTKAEAKARKLQVVRPLAEKTMARIARGFKRHVLDREQPFIVRTDMTSAFQRNGVHGLDEPLNTVTTAGAFAVVTPYVSRGQHGGGNRPADEPLHTVCASDGDQDQVVAPFLAVNRFESTGQVADAPMPTITANSYIKRPGAGGPLSVAACYLAQQNTDMVGHDADKPLSTIVQKGCTQTPVMGYLATLRRNTRSVGPDEPLGTIATSGAHHAVVAPFVASYYSTGGQNSAADAPLPTVPTKARFSPIAAGAALPPLTPEMAERARLVARFLFEHGVWHSPDVLVTIGDFVVWDIGMRMLVPRELAGAQGFPVTYDITAGGRLTETAQRHKIGNSVCPPIAEAIVRANCIEALSLPNVRRRLAPLPARLAPRLAPPVGLFDGVAA